MLLKMLVFVAVAPHPLRVTAVISNQIHC